MPLSLRTKLGYGVADVGASLSYNAVNFFFLFFLVDVAGLRPGLAGAALLSGRLIDAVTDPLMGTLSDRTRSRYGRRKPYIWAGLVPFGVSFALLWAIPSASQGVSQGVIFTLAALALALHAVIYTVVQVPYMALTPELAPGYEARTALSSYRIGFGTLASLIAAAAPPLLVASINDFVGRSETDQLGWTYMGVTFGAVMSASYLLMALSVREPRASLNPQTSKPPPLRSVLETRGYLALIALFVSVTLGLGIVSSMLPFYLASLQLSSGEQTLILGLLFTVAILALPLWNITAGRAGKSGALALGLAVLIVGLLLIVLVPSVGLSPSLLTSVTLAGVGTGAALLFPWAMLPDVAEFDLLAHGARREGLLYAVFTFAQKSAFALGAALNAGVLELAHYDADVPSSAQSAITWMVGPAAALAFLVALLLAWRYPIRKADHDAVREMLERKDKIQKGE